MGEDIKVIIVEDEELVAKVYQGILKEVSSEVLVAKELAQLDTMLAQTVPDAVVIDLRLKHTGVDEGIAHIPKIRAVNPDAVIVVASGTSEPEKIKKALAAGADYYAVKPETGTADGLIGAILKGFERKQKSARTISLIEKLTNAITSKPIN